MPFSNEKIDSNMGNKNYYTLFKEGFTIGISNPKAIAFFTALFP